MGKVKELMNTIQQNEYVDGLLEELQKQQGQIVTLNQAFHDMLQYVVSRGEINALLTHPNSTIRLTARSYMEKEDASVSE